MQLRGASLPGSANPTIADAYGYSGTDPGLRGGWMYLDDLYRRNLRPGRYGVNRDAERIKARSVYYLNPLLQAAVRIVKSFLIGDAFGYGEVFDKTARIYLEEFWQANNLGALMSERWLPEYLLDGENATVWPTGQANPGADVPARIAFLDMDAGVRVDSDTALGTVAADMVHTLRLPAGYGLQDRTWGRGEFVWTANDAMFNDPRGFPVVMGAVDAAMAYIALGNHRLNIHEVQQRIVGIYTAMLNPEDADGGLANWRAKAGAFKAIPPKGAVVPLVTKPGYTDSAGNKYDGVTEKLEFPRPASGAADAEKDAAMFLRLVGLCLGGLPEHWLGNGGNVNRASASEMSTPAIRIAQDRQATMRSYLDRTLQTELERRAPGRLYRVPTTRVSPDGLSVVKSYRSVPARLLTFPWTLPAITEDSLDTLLNVTTTLADRGWISDQSAASRLGVDVPQEVELMAAAGQVFGQRRAPTPGQGGEPNADAPEGPPGTPPA